MVCALHTHVTTMVTTQSAWSLTYMWKCVWTLDWERVTHDCESVIVWLLTCTTLFNTRAITARLSYVSQSGLCQGEFYLRLENVSQEGIKSIYKFCLTLLHLSCCLRFSASSCGSSGFECPMNLLEQMRTLNHHQNEHQKHHQNEHQKHPSDIILEQLQPSLLNRIDWSQRPLIDWIQSPSEESSLPLLTRIWTQSSMNVGEEDLQNCQPSRTCLSPWNGSPISCPIPERRRSYPSLPKSIPLIERLSNTLPISNQATKKQIPTIQTTLESETCFPSKRKQSQTELFEALLNGQPSKRIQRMKTMSDLNDNNWDSQTCLGTDQQEEGHSSLEQSVATGLVSSSSSMEKTFQGANFLSEPHLIHLKVSRSPNGSRYSKENLSTSTISFLQSSALRSMRIGRHALERHISLSTRATRRERSKVRLTGQQHGNEPQKQLLSLSLTDGESWMNTKGTSKPNLMPSSQVPINESLPMTLQSGITSEEGRCLYSPTTKDFPTYIPPSSYQTELNLRLQAP